MARETAMPGKPVIDPADWGPDDLAGRDGWEFQIDAAARADLRAMCAHVRRTIDDDPNGLMDLDRTAFDLGAFTPIVEGIWQSLKDGAGVTLVRGLPMTDIDLIDAAVMFWGLGRHLGDAVSNNPDGDLLGHVTDLGGEYSEGAVRGYQTNDSMDFHCDQVPIAALFCVRPAQTGGLSKISSSVRIYNELLAHRPDLVEVLSKPLVWTKYGEGEPGEVDHYESPVFDFLDGYLCTALGPKHIKKGHALPNVPDLTAPQAEAVRVAEELAAEFHFATRLEAGDVLLTNNFVALHTRDGFVDWPEPERRRLMWRLWLVNDELRPPTAYARQWRHGIRLSTTQDRLVLS